jgi:photosystem II stability/assembly factor-like uncharacterized protein
MTGIIGTLGYSRQVDPEIFKSLKYRHIGPVGNRVIAVVGVPGDQSTCYIGAASGGIFKTTNGGINWRPIFDKQQVSSVSSLAIDPSDPKIIWAGTGEVFIRSNISIGNGIYKSTDAGKKWTHLGLEKTGRIGRILINPENPNIVYAAAMGHCYGPQPERGVFRTTDGGENWERVLFVGENTGCSDIAMDPNNPQILFAGMWQLQMWTWGRESGGAGSGLYMSQDGGTTWKHLTGNGLPHSPLGKIAVAIAPGNSNKIYALIETGDGVPWKGQETDTGVLWRSDDGGKTWALINHNHELTQRPHYYSRCAVSPDNDEEIYFCAVRFSISKNGGKTTRMSGAGGDNHDLWVDPKNAKRIIVGHDQGVSISLDRAKSWQRFELPIAQMYHVYVDNRIPYYVYGNRQDGPSTKGPSNSRTGGIPRGMWHSVGGFESGFAVPDPVDNDIVWSGGYEGDLDRYNEKTRQSRKTSVWPDYSIGWPAADLKYRFNWTFPIVISPHDHNRVYVASQYVHQTTDGGHSWAIISPDLSTNDKSKQQISGGLTPDNSSPEYCCAVFALAESPLEEGLLWAGTNDGLVHVTRSQGKDWTNVTKNIPDLSPWGTVSNIEPSRYDAGTCYITVDFHQMNNRDPYVYKTSDYGQTWTNISSDIPKSVFSYAHCVREDPKRKGTLYLGTENALYVSLNDGENWLPLQTNLPHAPVHWLVVQEHFNDLVVATYGRGFWILDDITPLQQISDEILESEVHLFTPRPAYRFRNISPPMTYSSDPTAGQNPPYGAFINYYLKTAPKGKVQITIFDDKGQEIYTINGARRGGINRTFWNLRYKSSEQIKLKTSPLYAPHVKVSKRGWRRLIGWGGPVSPVAAPGIYTIRLKVGEKEWTQSLEVLKDPHTEGTVDDIRAQVDLLLKIRDNSTRVADMVNLIEDIRKQIYDLNDKLKEEGKDEIPEADKLDKKLMKIEGHMVQLKLTGSSQDSLRWPMKLYCKLSSLAGGIGQSDFPPTTQQIAVQQMFEKQTAELHSQLEKILDSDIPSFNKLLKKKNLKEIVLE